MTRWFKLEMDNSKTEIILYGTNEQSSKMSTSKLNVGGCDPEWVKNVRNLGVYEEKVQNLTYKLKEILSCRC